MRKRLLTMLTALLSMGLYAQVGIGTEDPKASLDIVANTASPTANGLLVPRLTATQVQTMETQVGDDQNALLVYVTATFTASPTDARYTDIDAIGYYYYDAKDNTPNGKWKKLGNGGGNYTAGAGIQIGGGVVSATGLERSVVTSTYGNDYYAWSLIGRDKQIEKGSSYVKPQYLPLGYGAVDLSHGEESQTQSPTGASGVFSFASGYETTASGHRSTAIGSHTTASGDWSTAMGVHTTASKASSTAMGYGTTASGEGSIAMGQVTTASGNNSTAMGFNTNAWGDYSTAMGRKTYVSGWYSTAMGYETSASGWYSFAMGRGSLASGYYSVAMGGEYDNGIRPAKALGKNSLAFGSWSEAQADHSIAMGWGQSANQLTKATGEYAIAMGYGTTASGTHSVAMGGELDGTTFRPAKALGKNSFAFGRDVEAQADHSIAMGWGYSATQLTKATAKDAIAMGNSAVASGTGSVAIGTGVNAQDQGSIAIGANVISSGMGSVAIGFGFFTSIKATGDFSTALGINTTASGNSSTAMGKFTEAPYDSSIAMGAHNATPTNALLMVGNGNFGNRQNALTIYKDGTIEAKKIYDTTNGNDSDRVVVVSSSGKLRSTDNVTKSKIDELYKKRLVPINQINQRSGRTRITGTSGYWIKNGNGWYYTGVVRVVAVKSSGSWFTYDYGIKTYYNSYYKYDTAGAVVQGNYVPNYNVVIKITNNIDEYGFVGFGTRYNQDGRTDTPPKDTNDMFGWADTIRNPSACGSTPCPPNYKVVPVPQLWYYDE